MVVWMERLEVSLEVSLIGFSTFASSVHKIAQD